jgi:NitT/TauT family transport system substrate-binding protein
MKTGFDELRRRALIGIAFAGAGLVVSLLPFMNQAFAEPLRVGANPTVNCALIYLADSQGFFKKQGVDVIIKDYETGPLAVNDLVADKVDIATAVEIVLVLQSFRYPDLRIPATISMVSNHDLVVRKDRGIVRPQDLKGKRVAVTRGSSSEFFFYTYLIFNRIPAGSVNVVYQTPSEMVKAMADGTIDAAVSWPPYPAEMAKRLGSKGARWLAQSGQDGYMALLAKEGFLRKQSKTIERFLAALSDAQGYIAKYPDHAQTIVRQRFKDNTGSFSEAWSRSRLELQLTQDMIVLMELEAKWAMRNNLVKSRQMPSYLDFLYFNALDRVKPEAVSVVH